jgi:hypothetical protein
MQQWEYSVAEFLADDLDGLQKEICGIGRNGWELVAVTRLDGPAYLLWFKRPETKNCS